MKNKTILFLVLVLLFSILLIDYGYPQGEEKEQTKLLAFVSGNEYLEYTENNKTSYIEGLVDMLFCQTYAWAPEIYSNLKETTRDMTAGQIKAIFERYLEKHPEEWHWGAASLFSEAMMEIDNK